MAEFKYTGSEVVRENEPEVSPAVEAQPDQE
jgi:hypothetical protein